MSSNASTRRPGSTDVSASLLGAALASLALACDPSPGHLPLEYSLNEKTLPALESVWSEDVARAVGDQIAGALGMLFGTPSNPRFLSLEEWIDDGFAPNLGGYAELSDEAFDEVKEDNLRRFARQIHLIDERRYAEVPEPRYAADLWSRWRTQHLPGLLEDPDQPYDAGDEELGTRHEEARYLFESWYPTLRESADMYRVQCLHCHGVEGGGDGPTAEFLEPLPRDYREGKFKWVAVDRNRQPRRDDLLRILRDGATFTAMPSFDRFSRGELEGLIDYVRLLSIRGEVENLLVNEALAEEELPASAVLESYELVWDRWLTADEQFVAYEGDVPHPSSVSDEMLAHGRELFLGNIANCYTCHGLDGRGNGESIYEVDEEGNRVVRLDEWGNPSDPRDFTRGIFRGGNRPIDLYRRVKYGISGTIMPAADTSLTDQDLWSIVYYVLSIAEEHDVNRAEEHKALASAAHADHGEAEPTHD